MVHAIMIRNLIKELLEPELKKYGFEAEGLSFWKETGDHYIYSLIVQLNRFGTSFCVEMGVHVDFLPNSLNQVIKPSDIAPYDCLFRKRLSPADEDYWWDYGKTEKDAISSIQQLTADFKKYGLNYFNQFGKFPDPLDKITAEDFAAEDEIFCSLGAHLGLRLASAIARIKLFSGNKEDAIKICRWGLDNIQKKTMFIPVFENIIKEANTKI